MTAALHAATPADLAHGLRLPFGHDDWRPELLAWALTEAAQLPLSPDGVAALAAARGRLADLQAAADAMNAAGEALARQLMAGDAGA